jgi:nucleoid-associated protein YgaU
MQPQTIRQTLICSNRPMALAMAALVISVAGCHADPARDARPLAASTPAPAPAAPAGDQRTAMEAAIDAGPSTSTVADAVVLAPNAPGTYVVKRGDTLWGISKVFLRDPWYWPEIWQVNPQIQNPHLIYPGDTLRLVYIDGKPHIQLQRGATVRVEPRVRSEPLESAVTAIPYETVAAFMSKPFVLASEQVKGAPYLFASRDTHVIMAAGNTVYARGFSAPTEVGALYNVVRVGDPLRDPDDGKVVGYDGLYTASGHVTRSGDPTSLMLTESNLEAEAGDKLFPGLVDVPLDFIPSPPKTKINGRIMAVRDGVTMIGQYQVVVINRGARDGLAPGNVLAVYGRGEKVRDNQKTGFVNYTSDLFAPKVRLPDERNGTFMVFKTFDRISYGLIMEATDIIRVADRVENP